MYGPTSRNTLLGVLVAIELATVMPAAAQASNGGLPDKAEVIYRGTTEGRIGEPVRVSVRVPRRLTLRGVMGAVDVPERRRTSGAVTLRLTFDGAAVTGRMNGTGALRPDSLSGAVENGVCRLSNAGGTSVWEGRCDARGFSGTFKSHATAGLVIDGRFETSAERVSDLAQARPITPATPPPSRETSRPQQGPGRLSSATAAVPAPVPTYGASLDTTRLTSVPTSGKSTFQLTASMSSIDDIGEIYVLSDGVAGRYALTCAWSGGLPGEGSVGLDSYLNVGKNLVVFALYDRRVVGFASVLTPGRFGYQFQLSDHAGQLWSATGAGITNGAGYRYVRAIHVRREPSGAIRVMPQLTAADRARINDVVIPRLASAIEGGGLNTTDLAGRSSCETGDWSELHTVGWRELP